MARPPFVAIWAIESRTRPDWIGWWVITGDLPTDYISVSEVEPPQHPRKALRVFAEKWKKYVHAWKQGLDYPGTAFEPSMREHCAPLLETRADMFLEWVDDDENWEESDD